MMLQKLSYVRELVQKRLMGVGLACPDCTSKKFILLDRKYVISELRRCADCRLIYRAPTEQVTENAAFYQSHYSEGGYTTALPSDEELARLKAANFNVVDREYGPRIAALQALGLGPGARVFDFGCSWGYGSWLLQRAGFKVLSYEISKPRAQFARDKLDIEVLKTEPDSASLGPLRGSVDCFFSSHVLEHLPHPSAAFALARAMVKPGGWMVAFTPNGSLHFRAAAPHIWHRLWGKVHPTMIDEEFYRQALGDNILVGATPVDHRRLAEFGTGKSVPPQPLASSVELMCVVRF
jgi:2-polyprenyl-3-methyl-5-hydroxy-6-metoxy-1,4-benzoquinol methylase